MMGLERLIQNTFGTTPQLDLDKKILRVRVPRPMAIDFPALAAGIHRNNVTPVTMDLEARFERAGDKLRLPESGQEFYYEGQVPTGTGVRILGFEAGEKLRAVPR
jgi:hypothetical protein